MTTLATDNFDRADGIGLGGSWSTANTSLNIKDGKASATLKNDNFYIGLPFPDNQWSQATLKELTNVSWVGVTVRNDDVGLLDTYYAGGADSGDYASNIRRVWKDIDGNRASLGAVAILVAVDDVLRIEAVDQTITLFVNDAQSISVTDASIASGAPGIIGRNTAGTDTPQLDDWSAGSAEGGSTKVIAWLLDRKLTETPGEIEFTISWTLSIPDQPNGVVALVQDASIISDAALTIALRAQLAAYVSMQTGQSFTSSDVRGLSFG